MNRFFLPPDCIQGQRVQFPEDVAHQIRRVLRMTPGDVVEVLDDSGHVFRVVLAPFSAEGLAGRVATMREAETEPVVCLELCFGLTGREKVEWILQKGTEIGVARFSPFISSRTLAQDPHLTDKKLARWERIIKEAAEQSQRGRLPGLNSPQSLDEVFAKIQSSGEPALIAWEAAEPGLSLRQALADFSGESLMLIVGPEGGFSEEEVAQARVAGCQVVSLGRRVLRMETAAILLPALVLFELED